MKVLALLSGGLDSATALWMARDQIDPSGDFEVSLAVSFFYGQTHRIERSYAEVLIQLYSPSHALRLQNINIPFDHIQANEVGHLLRPKLDPAEAHGTVKDHIGEDVSATYVPGRNIIMLAYAGSLCDSLGLDAIVGGWNAVDYSGYPDCRPAFLATMDEALTLGLRQPCRIFHPLTGLTKGSIIRRGLALGVPYEWTWSCYGPVYRDIGGMTTIVKDRNPWDGKKLARDLWEYIPCQKCPSCEVRAKGFKEVGIEDPLFTRLGVEPA